MPNYINKLEQPQHLEAKVLGPQPKRPLIGTIRVKPSSILWKPAGQRQFHAVALDAFASWITSAEARAERVKN